MAGFRSAQSARRRLEILCGTGAQPYGDSGRTDGGSEAHMSRPVVLVTASGGIGDILRITPLVRVFFNLGYEVDVLLAPDYSETVKLLEGAPEIRRLFYLPSSWSWDRQSSIDGLDRQEYEIATFTVWSMSLRSMARARRIIAFDRAMWLREGDIACVETIARLVGWTAPLPEPFAMSSPRRFGLPAQTIALHPGCNPGWPRKRWHGFAELDALLPEVAIGGPLVQKRAVSEWRAYARHLQLEVDAEAGC